MLLPTKFSRAPSPYPSLFFHAVRIVQFVSAVIVMSFLSFFVQELLAEHYYIPWTFIVPLAVSSFTIASTLITAFFYHYRTLQPRMSWLINTGLTALWALAFALLTWNLSGTLTHACSSANWTHDVGIMVCRIYKAVETFTITGFGSTAASLMLDLWVIRTTRARGVYNQMGDVKRPRGYDMDRVNNPHHHSRSISTALVRDDFNTLSNGSESNDGFGAAPAYGNASLEFPQYSHEAKRHYKTQRTVEAERFGYTVPEENTAYEGASARMLDRQFAEHDS